MPSFEDVVACVRGERAYQETRWQRPAHNHTVTEYLVYLDHYVKQGLARVSVEDGDKGALPDLRKIAALAFAAMEENGLEHRKLGDAVAYVDVTQVPLGGSADFSPECVSLDPPKTIDVVCRTTDEDPEPPFDPPIRETCDPHHEYGSWQFIPASTPDGSNMWVRNCLYAGCTDSQVTYLNPNEPQHFEPPRPEPAKVIQTTPFPPYTPGYSAPTDWNDLTHKFTRPSFDVVDPRPYPRMRIEDLRTRPFVIHTQFISQEELEKYYGFIEGLSVLTDSITGWMPDITNWKSYPERYTITLTPEAKKARSQAIEKTPAPKYVVHKCTRPTCGWHMVFYDEGDTEANFDRVVDHYLDAHHFYSLLIMGGVVPVGTMLTEFVKEL